MTKKILNFFSQIGSGYLRLLKWLLLLAIFLGILALFNFLTILPIRDLAVNQRALFNLITLSALSVMMVIALVRLIIRTGPLTCLIFLGLFLLLGMLSILPEYLSWLSCLLSLPYLIGLYFLKKRKLLKSGMITLLLILCYAANFYRLALLFAANMLYVALPAALFYLLFLGYILYEKRIHAHSKIFK